MIDTDEEQAKRLMCELTDLLAKLLRMKRRLVDAETPTYGRWDRCIHSSGPGFCEACSR